MVRVPFTKAHGCGNDFLIVPGKPSTYDPVEGFVRTICDRHFGIGADGIYFLATPTTGHLDAEIFLYNSDGSAAELSGNGTRCVAAHLARERGLAAAAGVAGSLSKPLRIRTGAGVKELWLVEQEGSRFRFRMRVGPARIEPGPEGTLSIWLGNPQCVLLVNGFDMDWQARGRLLGSHPFFPARTNVDFVRVIDRHTIEARFWERGAGHTLASGTGSTASAVAAVYSGQTLSPVTVHTEGGDMEVTWEQGGEAYLTGPTEIICTGHFLWTAP